jgi:uncharacterized protein YeaO (DUF488 family)
VPIQTRRFNDPKGPEDGFRLLVVRYRPRGVKREDETWDAWWPNLGPSVALHAAYYGKSGEPTGWDAYQATYLEEMRAQSWWIRSLAERVAQGEVLTLLCSSACTDEARCHRTLLRGLIEARLPNTPAAHEQVASPPRVVRRRS